MYCLKKSTKPTKLNNYVECPCIIISFIFVGLHNMQFYKLAFYTHSIMHPFYSDNCKISTIYVVRELLGSSVVYFNQRTHAYFSSCVLHEPLVHMMKKILFSSFSNVFYRFWPCKCMRKHAFAGRNTQIRLKRNAHF